MIGDRVADQSPKGMTLMFACTYGGGVPAELGFTGKENGWELRRKIKAYCKVQNLASYKIVRNTTYVRDLHGPAVYELYTPNRSRMDEAALQSSPAMENTHEDQ